MSDLILNPPCLDCREPIEDGLGSSKYPTDAKFSRCYLCAFCRTHRYTNEHSALSRCRAGLARLRGESFEEIGQ